MTEQDVANDAIRLLTERPTKRWYLKKNHYPDDINWAEVELLVRSSGYDCEDQGIVFFAREVRHG